VKDTLIEYNDIYFENVTLKMEMETLNDDSLLDECSHILASTYSSDSMEDILLHYFKFGRISEEDRKKAEGLYLLAYGGFGWSV
jgi:hypothetical protein